MNLENLFRRKGSLNVWTLVFASVLLIYILPIWVFKYFPSQDGPCHIYNSFILKHYNDPHYEFSKYYNITKAPIPNWASHISMMLMMYLVPPLIAEKLLLTGYVLLMALSMLYLVNSEGKGRTPLVFIGFPLIYNYLFLMGFYNFSLSVALFILVMGYWWKHFRDLSLKKAGILAFLLVLVYFCHLVSLVLAIFSIGMISAFSLLPRFRRWREVLLTLASMLPSVILALYYVSTRGMAESAGTWTLQRLWQYLIRNESLAYYSPSQIFFGKIVTGAFIALLVYTVIRDHFLREDWHWGFRIRRRDFFFLLFIAFIILYLKAPDGMSGGGFIKTRLALMPFLIIMPWLSWDLPKVARAVIGICLALLAVAYMVHASYYHKLLNDDLKVYTSGFDAVEENKVVLPLAFNRTGRCWRIAVFLHSIGHYGYTTGCIDLDNYEATTNYFPTSFRPDFRRPTHSIIEATPDKFNFAEYANDIDYVVTWEMAAGSDVEKRILKYYDLVRENGKLKVFRRHN